jgi:hypothetical protein
MPLVVDLFNLALVPKNSETGRKCDGLMMTGDPDDLEQKAKDFIAILEYENTEARKGGFRCIYPVRERCRDADIGQIMTAKSDCDWALESWISMTDDQKTDFLQNGLTAWTEYKERQN